MTKKQQLNNYCLLTVTQYPFLHPCTPYVTLDLPCRSLWPQLWAHLWCNPDWTTPTPLCMECQHLTCANYSLLKILLLVWFCFFFAIFQQVSDLVTSTGFLFTTEYSSKSLHLPIRPWQRVSHLISTISSNYTSHHELSVLQPSNYSKYHICLLTLVGAPSATAFLQLGIPFLPPSKIVHP